MNDNSDFFLQVFAFLHRPPRYIFPVVCDLEAEYTRYYFFISFFDLFRIIFHFFQQKKKKKKKKTDLVFQKEDIV